jgi:hypothetical protein
MADLRTSFPILEDSGTQAGTPIHKALEGDVIAAKNAHGAFIAKRVSDGTFRYLNMDDAGNLLTTQDGGGTPLTDRGTASGSLTNVTVAEITLTELAVYKGLSWVVSCFRDAIFEIVHIDDPAGAPIETILADVLAGAGDFTDSGSLKEHTFTAGAIDPVLRLRAKNQNALSDFRGTITTTMDAA